MKRQRSTKRVGCDESACRNSVSRRLTPTTERLRNAYEHWSTDLCSFRSQRDWRPPGRALRFPRLGRRAATGGPPWKSEYSIFASTTPTQNSVNPSGSRLFSAASSEVASAGFASSQSQDTTDSHAAHTKPASPGFGTRQRRGWHSHNTSAPPRLVQHHLEGSGSVPGRCRIRGCDDRDRVR